MVKTYDLTNRTFEFLTVLGKSRSVNGRFLWKCKCICGREIEKKSYDLRRKGHKSCGCRNGADLSDQEFGFLTAISPVIRGDGVRVWRCKCACGDDGVLVRAQSLVDGHTTSCGCKAKERQGKGKPKIIWSKAELRAMLNAMISLATNHTKHRSTSCTEEDCVKCLAIKYEKELAE